MPSVQYRDRQQIQHAQADTDQGQEIELGIPAVFCGVTGIIGDGDRPAEIVNG